MYLKYMFDERIDLYERVLNTRKSGTRVRENF